MGILSGDNFKETNLQLLTILTIVYLDKGNFKQENLIEKTKRLSA